MALNAHSVPIFERASSTPDNRCHPSGRSGFVPARRDYAGQAGFRFAAPALRFGVNCATLRPLRGRGRWFNATTSECARSRPSGPASCTSGRLSLV